MNVSCHEGDGVVSVELILDSNEAKAAHRNSLGPLQSQFITKNNTRVISQRGGLAVLPCSVTMTTPATVSWFRRKDYQLLTVGLSTYSSDDRFLVEHTRHLGNWALRIKNARKEDEGLYECQISTHPPQSIFIELRIVEAVAEILEAPDLHIDEGSTLRLECKLKRATESPLYVFWYHEDRMVNYDQEDGVSVSNNKLTSSILTVRNATARHGGNYTCAPANARQSSVYVHVLKGEKPAAMQHPNKSPTATSGAGTLLSPTAYRCGWLRLPARFGCCLVTLLTLLPASVGLILTHLVQLEPRSGDGPRPPNGARRRHEPYHEPPPPEGKQIEPNKTFETDPSK
uniref:Ig-like domain-containing protein n=1 Tax=Anopheles farauti TaxID=69004 RepID=A0A182QLN1_9DIPT